MYIIMDLDDTLLNNKREASEYTIKVLNKLQSEGHIIVINTARSLSATMNVSKIINADYSIMNGGALITKGQEIVYKHRVSNDITQKIIKELIYNNTKEFSVECEKGLFCNLVDYPLKNKNATYFDYNNPFPYEAYKILLCSEDGVLPMKLSEQYDLHITHYVGGPWYRLSLCNKQDGNLALYKLLGDNNPKSICFGDDIGDIEMLENATEGVALFNSVPKVLEKINKVTKYSNDEDGVAKYLEEYFYKK